MSPRETEDPDARLARRNLGMCKRLTVFGVAALLAVVTGLLAAHAQPAATIALPEPGGAKALYAGCNAVAVTFPNGTSSQAVANAVSPAGSLQAIWSYNTAQQRFTAFSPAAPQASDLLSVNFLDAVWVCVAGAPPAPEAIAPTPAPPMPEPSPAVYISPPNPVLSPAQPLDADLVAKITYQGPDQTLRRGWSGDWFKVYVENDNLDWYACGVTVYIYLFDEWGSRLWTEPVHMGTVGPREAVAVTTLVRDILHHDICQIRGESCWTEWDGRVEWAWSLDGCP
jgi:hypothetical protein